MILWLHSDENQGTRSTKCALSFEPGSSPELSASRPHSAGQRWSQLLVSHTIRKGDCSGQSDTQPAHRSFGSGPHETCLSVRAVAVSTVCHRHFQVTMAVLAPWQKLFVRKKKKGIPSGSTLHIRRAQFFLVRMREHKGHQCHTGRTTSFSRNEPENILPFG